MLERNLFIQPMEAWPLLGPFGKFATLKFDDLNVFYFETGDINKHTIFLIHGLGDEADTWRHVILPLAKNYHVVALDLPGFGRSDKPDQRYTPRFLMNAITGLMDQLEINQAILMGSSLGGILSHAIALDNPNRIEGLILVGGALIQSGLKAGSLNLMRIPLLGEFIYTRLRKDPDAAYKTLESFYYDLNRLPQKDQDFLYLRVNQRVWSNGQRRAYFSTLRNLIPWIKRQQQGLELRLQGLKTPVLVIRGEFDSLFSQTDSENIKEVQTHADFVQIDSTGHLPHQEDPESFLNFVNRWMFENFG